MPSSPRVDVTKLEHRADSPFVPTAVPRLSWVTSTDVRDWRQAWAEIEAGGQVVRLDADASVLVAWPFAPLEPGEERTVRVRVGGVDGTVSEWSEPRTVAAAFLAEGAWTAPLIALPTPERQGQPGLLRAEFDVDAPVERAILSATAHGVYQVEINGTAVDEDTLKPGWTAYQWRVIQDTTDVTALLRPGRNAIGVQLTAGWFAERYGFGADAKPFYGDQPSAALRLELRYADGRSQVVATGPRWRGLAGGPVLAAGIYGGQHEDATHALPGWSEPGFDDRDWAPAEVGATVVPVPRSAPPVRAVAELPVVATSLAPSGATILDFGQNLAGRVRIAADLPAGTTITLRHAEVLHQGELDRRSQRGAAATDVYVAPGGPFTWEPRFTFHGFRYASVEGWPGDVPVDAFTAVALSSDLEPTGAFASSHPLVDALHRNVVWSTRSNFVSLPTDCPQRDERLGWTGDISMFAPTAASLLDVDGFLAGWLADVAVEQEALGGTVPFVVPNVSGVFISPTAAWGDAATIVPWTLYERYGDTAVLEAQYPSMTSWVDLVAQAAGENHLWEGGFQFADWLDPTAPADSPTDAKADKELVATAFLFRSADIVARTAEVLGRAQDAARYRRLADAVRAAFLREYVAPSGRIVSDAQTAYALAIVFGLVPDEERRLAMGRRLAKLVRVNGYRIGTGFVGTPFVLEALATTGQQAAATRLLTATECPSWLYPITMGATTTWEAWDALLPDGTPNPASTSFNHYAFGAVVDWLHRGLAGLAPAEPGYRSLRIAPVPLPAFDHAEATHRTPYGTATAGWRREGDTVHVHAVVPANTRATVRLPDGSDAFEVGSGEHTWTVDAPLPASPRLPALSLETALGDIIDDPAAHATVLDVFDRHAPQAARTLRTRSRWEDGLPLSVEFFILPKAVQAAIDADLRAASAADPAPASVPS
ncbi:family 78 glycoside hydrolase catalytic domain [Amnibacterium sp. CER49]|uniref:alpha-L-rhamnosidase n=1 Tax=Amnibacterium sp. CER49 TaxID=3039161 RepID=UPI002447566E|nr:alpha-L-rhamnosidase [Amnibacterium sp. CER49]MDH2444847.1 family 78 glycoside hydrolase catalytic domain [Amnibacterium sp. CER49]